MGHIAVLPDDVVNKIAAGEIIERPVSIVKELIENSLDAGATEIRIEIEKGGKHLIRVTDDGRGIPSTEALLAFERHATSKLKTSEDLHQVATMGFRGEALASIASVSQVEIKTKYEEEGVGTNIFLVNGECQKQQPIAMPHGTTIESRNLFFNIPARRKFLKSDASEAGAIQHMVRAFALANPEISFFLYQDQKEILNCPTTSGIRDRIFQIFGAEMLESLLEIHESLYQFKLTGFVSNPAAMKSNRNYQYFFINRRYVKDKVLSNSVYVAYRVFALTGQYPIALLFLEMPPETVDVNVHPAKYEVRFLQQSVVQKGIIDSIQKALQAARPMADFQLAPGSIPRYSSPELNLQRPTHFTAGSAMPSADPGTASSDTVLQMPSPPGRRMPQEGEYKMIGQYDNTYILLSDESGLILVDQHVAHERILYEQLQSRDQNHPIRQQALLIPLVLDVNPAQMMLLEDYLDRFREIGLEIEVFGTGSIVIKQIPDLLTDSNYSVAIQKLIDDLERIYRDGLLESFGDEMRKSMACQAAIKINMPLTMEKMEYLIRELLKTATPQVCPHGRPIILRISHYEIEKNFKRI